MFSKNMSIFLIKLAFVFEIDDAGSLLALPNLFLVQGDHGGLRPGLR